jgi:type I restriction enzyme M protein
MNLMLHGIEQPNLLFRDALSEANHEIKDRYSLILANPPFKGSLDYDAVDKSILSIVKSKKTELLFLGLMLRMLRPGGRAAVIVPDGVLFGSSKAHKKIREEIIENHRLEGIVSMPSGVFKPYAGVSTAIIIFTKTGTGGTDKVWFYKMEADGYSLDDKRQPKEENDIPNILKAWRSRESDNGEDRSAVCFQVPKEEIVAQGYDLSINRYKKTDQVEVEYDAPVAILKRISEIDVERVETLKTLRRMLE